MAQGTGLPLPKPGTALARAPSVSADNLSSAAEWSKVAAAGRRVADTALDTMEQDAKLLRAGEVASFENDWRQKNVEARDKFSHDPEGFKQWAEGSISGALSSVPPYRAKAAENFMRQTFNGSYSSILSEKRARDGQLADQALEARRKGADDDVMALAGAGKAGTSEFAAAVAVHDLVLQERVNAGRVSQEQADYQRDELIGRSMGETAARQAVDVYREGGFQAAVDHLNKNIRENDALKLKPAQRERAFQRGLSAVRLQQQVDREDRTEIVESSREIIAKLDSQQHVDPGEVRDTLRALNRVGAAAAYHKLSVAAATAEATAPFKGGLKLNEFANVVSGHRLATQSQSAQQAMTFLEGQGFSKVQAAGIVGNLIQESGSRLDPTRVHDQGTGIGIAGWRLERREALRSFAAAKGKPITDFQTQLEFLVHELNTTEGEAGRRLREAKTPAEAAEAFIHFERPAGFTPANARAGHGFGNRVRNAQALAGQEPDGFTPEGTPYAGEVTKKVQSVFVGQARKAWPEFKNLIDQGKVIDAEDLTSIRYAAALSGDANWQQEVEARYIASQAGAALRDMPEGQRQGAMDQIRADMQRHGLSPVDQESVNKSLTAQFDRQNRMVRDDPVSYAIERGQAAPAPLDFGNPQAALGAVQQRVALARGVADEQDVPVGSPFRAADRAAIAGAIADPQRQGAVFAALAGLPDEMLTPALNAAEIKQAVLGSTRSGDPKRYGEAMSFMDRIWARDPNVAKQVFGEEAIHGLMTWQANLRYLTPDQQAKEREKKALDPGVRERMKRQVQEGEAEARKVSLADVAKKFDTSWWITPGPLARMTGSQPLPPIDRHTADALMSDFENIYGRRYSELLGDKDEALKQTVELLKTKWVPSPVNGGRLMLNAPETLRDRNGNAIYPAVGGSYDWMKQQLDEAVRAEVFGQGPRDPAAEAEMGGDRLTWTLVSDRQTQAEAQNGVPATYQVIVKDAETGRSTPLARRFVFDPGPAQMKARTDFEASRRRVFEQRAQGTPNMAEIGVP